MATDTAPGTAVEGAWPPYARPDHPAARYPLVLAWRCGGTAFPAAPTAAAGLPSTPPRRAGDTDHALAQDAAPSIHAERVLPVRGHDASPRGARWRQHGHAHDTRHRTAGARSYHEDPASQMVPMPHPPAHGTTGRHGGQDNRRLGPRLPWGLGQAGVAVRTTGAPGMWPGAVLPGRLFPRATPDSNAAPSSPT